jgi:uncharacterized protein YoxC
MAQENTKKQNPTVIIAIAAISLVIYLVWSSWQTDRIMDRSYDQAEKIMEKAQKDAEAMMDKYK